MLEITIFTLAVHFLGCKICSNRLVLFARLFDMEVFFVADHANQRQLLAKQIGGLFVSVILHFVREIVSTGKCAETCLLRFNENLKSAV